MSRQVVPFRHCSKAIRCRLKSSSMWYAIVLLLIVCIATDSAIAQSDQPVSLIPEISESMEPVAVWSLLSQPPLVLKSNVHEDGFSMEMFALQADTSELRVILDQRIGQVLEAGMTNGDAGGFRNNGDSIEISDGKFVLVKLPMWDTDPASKYPLNVMMALGDDKQPVCWDSRVRNYYRRTKKGGFCRVSLRTPSDCERWNCGWQNLSIWSRDRCLSEIRRVVVGSDKEQRLQNSPGTWFNEWIQEHANQPQSIQRESLFGRITYQEEVRKHAAWLPIDATLRGHAEMLQAANLQEGNEELVRKSVDRFFTHVQAQIPVWMTRATLIPFTLAEVESASLSMDDPAMRYWRSELIAGPSRVAYLNEFVRKIVLRNKSIPLETRLAVCNTLGNMGRPAILFEPLALIEDRLLCEAVLFSRWQYPLLDEHVEACLASLNSSEPNRRSDSILVESLVRMDELNRIPEPRREEWWNLQVVSKSRGKNFEHTEDPAAPRRDARFHHLEAWETICMTSRTPSVREFLRKRLDTNDPQLVKRAIYHCLRLRAESTVRTKRWDFMTEAECDNILALPAPHEPGKDTEDGAARPFPKDE